MVCDARAPDEIEQHPCDVVAAGADCKGQGGCSLANHGHCLFAARRCQQQADRLEVIALQVIPVTFCDSDRISVSQALLLELDIKSGLAVASRLGNHASLLRDLSLCR